MKKDCIEITKDLIPYSFEISLADVNFILEIKYNATHDLFTIDLYKDEELICAGEPIIYGVPLWNDVYLCGKYPELVIVPSDENENYNAVTWDNFNESVYLFIDNTGDEDE